MRINLYLTPSNPPAPPLPLLGDPSSSSSSSTSGGGSSSSVASTSRFSAPKPLLALCPNGELVLIELQGSLEMEGLDSELSSSVSGEGTAAASTGGQVVGEFSWGEGKEDKPTLLLSHHRLEGKLVTLGRPLAVLEKRRRKVVRTVEEREDEVGEEAERRPTFLPSSPDLRMATAAGNPLLEDSDEEDEGADGQGRGRSISPTVQRMKRDHGAAVSSGSKINGSLKADQDSSDATSLGQGQPNKKAKLEPTQSSSTSTNTPSRPTPHVPPSSSPSSTPLAPMRGSALDFSSPQPPSSPPPSSRAARTQMSSPLQERAGLNNYEEEEAKAGRTPTSKAKAKTKTKTQRNAAEGPPTSLLLAGDETPTQKQQRQSTIPGARKRQTSTYYDVVCIVRKKVLFSKRPEPVVHGLGAVAAVGVKK